MLTIFQVFSLIAQNDSKSSATIALKQGTIAEMAAQDSKVMRTIGILTLVFLPSTLVTVCVLVRDLVSAMSPVCKRKVVTPLLTTGDSLFGVPILYALRLL
jgi:hypothetical protein